MPCQTVPLRVGCAESKEVLGNETPLDVCRQFDTPTFPVWSCTLNADSASYCAIEQLLIGIQIGDNVVYGDGLALVFVHHPTRSSTTQITYPDIEDSVTEPVVLGKPSVAVPHQMLDPVVKLEPL